MTIYQNLIILFIATIIFGWGAHRFGMPIVVGQLLAGIIIGPSVFKLVSISHELNSIAEIGVLLLMFIVGIETDIKQLLSHIKTSLTVALLGALLPLGTFFLLAQIFHYNTVQSIFWGIVFSATSVSITAEVLSEYNQLKTKSGVTILGAAVGDDILAVLILTGFMSSFGLKNQGTVGVPQQLMIAILFFILFWLFSRYILPKIVQYLWQTRLPAIAGLIGVLLAITSGYFAEKAGVSAVVGAFFAGVALARANQAKQIMAHTMTIGYGFFIPIFFASIGLKMTLTGLGDKWFLLIIMTIAAIVTKWARSSLGAKITGMSTYESHIIGLGMVSRGEMALIIADIGLSTHLITNGDYSELAVVILASTLFAPIALRRSLLKSSK